MIKIERTPCPTFLSIEKAKEFTNKFRETGKSVWKNNKLKNALLEMSNYKCAYCETRLEELHYNNFIDCAFRNKFKGLLSACSADTPFSAFTSNTLHNDHYYSEIKEKLKSNNLWNDELDELDKVTKKIALDPR